MKYLGSKTELRNENKFTWPFFFFFSIICWPELSSLFVALSVLGFEKNNL